MYFVEKGKPVQAPIRFVANMKNIFDFFHLNLKMVETEKNN